MSKKVVQIDTSQCIGCGSCVSACPEEALTLVNDVSTVTGNCTLKGDCVGVCPVGCMSLPE